MNFKISVVMVIKNYNHKKLKRCVNSVDSQSYKNYEIIIKHNGSLEEFSKLKKDFNGPLIKIISMPDTSLGDAANQAMEYVTGDIISIFHHDDCFCENAFSTLIENLDDSMWYFGDIHYHSMGTKVPTYYREHVSLPDMKQENYIPQPACFFKKEVYQKIGKFNSQFKLCWDYDYWVRILKKYKPKYIPFSFANYYLNENSISLKFPQEIMDAEKLEIQNSI
jgi:glycosyltransferase involved in cell wall biosynthesis